MTRFPLHSLAKETIKLPLKNGEMCCGGVFLSSRPLFSPTAEQSHSGVVKIQKNVSHKQTHTSTQITKTKHKQLNFTILFNISPRTGRAQTESCVLVERSVVVQPSPNETSQ